MFRRLWYLLNRRRLARELEEEMQFHAEQSGQPFGDVTRWRERSRDEWGWRGAEETISDVRYALRGLRRQPGYAVAAFLLLTFGVTANTAVFSVVRSVILSSLPVRDPGSLVQLGYQDLAENEFRPNHTYQGFELFGKEARTVRDLFAFSDPLEGNAIVNGTAGMVRFQAITTNALAVLGVGREQANDAVAVSQGYAERRGLAPGSTVTINSLPFTVAQVLPSEFRSFAVGESVDVYLHEHSINEVLMRNARNPSNMWFRVIGRLQPGVTIEQAQAELDPISRRSIENLYANLPVAMLPQVRKVIDNYRFRVIEARGGARSELRDTTRAPLLILLGSAALLLLTACANVAGLALARSMTRHREFGIRMALGCGRVRLLRQMLTESLLIAFAAGGAALLLEPVARQTIGTLVVGAQVEAADGAVLLFLCALTLLTGTAVGFVPAWRACNNARLVEDRSARSPRLAKVLISVQVGMSLVLLVGAALFVQTFRSYRKIDPGYIRERLITVRVNPGTLRYSGDQLLSYYRAGLQALHQVPGVSSATISRWATGDLSWTTLVEVGGQQDRVARNLAGPRFAATVGMTLVAGRDLTDLDVQRRTALVNESFVKRYFGLTGAIGRPVKLVDNNAPFEIVGVLKDARDRGPKHSMRPTVYTAWESDPMTWLTYNIRTRTEPEPVIAAIRGALQSVNRQAPIMDVQTAEDLTDSQLRREQMMASFGSVFGVLALLVASVGLFALLAHSVARRTREIGIRIAVGASPTKVLAVIARQAGVPLLAGTAVGYPLALAASWAVRSELHGVEPADPLVLAAATSAIVMAATLASLIPALRAMRIDPVRALRHE